MEVKKNGCAPFGTKSGRFCETRVHPLMRTQGEHTELPIDVRSRLGPGMYYPDLGGFHQKAVEERASGPGWARQHELERLASIPRLLRKDEWFERQEMKHHLGPGSYEFKDFLQVLNEKPSSIRGICDVRQARFGKSHISITQGPGTYGKNGIPQAVLDEKANKSASNKCMMDSPTACRGKLTAGGCGIGPGNYHLQGLAEEVLNRVVGLRGPYDIFSAERNKPVTTGHFATTKNTKMGPGHYEIKSSFDDWNTNGQKHKGKFGTVAQYPFPPVERIFNSALAQYPKPQNFPGPSVYAPKIRGQWPKPIHRIPKKGGFLSSSLRVDRRALRIMTKNYNHVGVGRYNVNKFDEARHVNGHTSIFKSKMGQTSTASEYVLRERLRGKDIPPTQANTKVLPQGLPGEEKARHMYSFHDGRTAQ